MTIKETLAKAKEKLKTAGILEPDASAEVLLCNVLQSKMRNGEKGKRATRADLYTNSGKELSLTEQKKFEKFIERRLNHEPVWQIIGEVEFWGMPFKVTKDVLVPRPETEFLVEEALKRITNYELRIMNKKNHKLQIIDIGTGSGAIAIALAHELSCNLNPKTFDLFATDISEKALKVAKQNAKQNGVDDLITFVQADLFQPTQKTLNLKPKTYNLITANLPYIPHEEMESLAFDVYHYEPRIALNGGKKGLEIYENFLKELPDHLEIEGVALCEIGEGQGQNFCAAVEKYCSGFKCEIRKDLAGYDRIAIIRQKYK